MPNRTFPPTLLTFALLAMRAARTLPDSVSTPLRAPTLPVIEGPDVYRPRMPKGKRRRSRGQVRGR